MIWAALALLAGIIAKVISWRAVASFLIVLFMLTFTAIVVLTVYKFAGHV